MRILTIRFLITAGALLGLAPVSAFAGLQMRLGYAYPLSKIDYVKDSTSFSIVSETGSLAGGQLTLSTGMLGLFVFGSQHTAQFKSAASRTILSPQESLTQVGGGLELRMGGTLLYLRASQADHPVLLSRGGTTYELLKYQQTVGEIGFQLSAFTTSYLLYLGLSGGGGLNSQTVETYPVQYGFLASGVTGIEFGRGIFRFGFEANLNLRTYKADANHTTQDFGFGTFIAIGASNNRYGVEKYNNIFGGGGGGGGGTK